MTDLQALLEAATLPLVADDTADYAEIYDQDGNKVALTTEPKLILALNEMLGLLARIASLESAARMAHALIDCIEQRPNNDWGVNADDPEMAVCDAYSALGNVLGTHPDTGRRSVAPGPRSLSGDVGGEG